MVPDTPPSRNTDAARDDRDDSPSEFDEARLYRVIHSAVRDALLDVVGMVLLVGVAVVLVIGGAQVALFSMSTVGAVVGAVLVVVGLYLGAATLEVIPPIREWF
jgi:hypothetical protein